VASIKLLLHAGAAVDATTNDTTWERTALMVACCVFCNLQIVEALLQGGADPCYQDSSDGKSTLHLAAAVGCTRTCRALHTASSGRALELRGKGDELNATPLIAACAAEQYAVVELLCALGADVNHSSVTGSMPLMTAATSKGRTSILRFLLQQNGIKVNHRNDNGHTALTMAAYVGNEAAVKLLLQHGADACNMNNSGSSAASAATVAGHVHVLKLLMQHGADITVTRNHGFTLLMQAAARNQSRVAEYLINAGISVHAADSTCSTALHCAALSTISGTETMRMLLAHGADVNAYDSKLSTPLHGAAKCGKLANTEVLIAAGADVTCGDAAGATALHLAIHFAHLTTVKLLLEHGAAAVLNTMQYRAVGEHSTVSAVMICNDSATLKLLLPAGADLHAVNSDGKTAAEVAHDCGHTLLEQLLIRAAQQA
jgi:uncharacterized protein